MKTEIKGLGSHMGKYVGSWPFLFSSHVFLQITREQHCFILREPGTCHAVFLKALCVAET